MDNSLQTPCTAFADTRRIAHGALTDVAQQIMLLGSCGPILVFDDTTGSVIDLDLRGSPAEVTARLREPGDRLHKGEESERAPPGSEAHRSRGRPRLGVVSREVTLLPRHWDWLSRQPGGASQALRRLVDEARRDHGGQAKAKVARERTYRFLAVQAGNLPGYEEVIRALFADREEDFITLMALWPTDVSAYARQLADLSADKGGEQ